MGVSSPRPIGMRKEEVERIDIDEEEGGPKTSSRPASAMGGRFDDDVSVKLRDWLELFVCCCDYKRLFA